LATESGFMGLFAATYLAQFIAATRGRTVDRLAR
jgi:hypothetical protein